MHVLLPEMLAEKYPELANKLRSTSPRWGWRTGRLKPGIARPEPEMATPSPADIGALIAPMAQGEWRPDPDGFSGSIVWDDEDLNRVRLGVDEYPDRIELGFIEAEQEGTGAGTHVLDAIKRYASEKGLPIVATGIEGDSATSYFESQGFSPSGPPEGGAFPDMIWRGSMATPSFDLFSWTKRNRPGQEKKVERSELELPPAPVRGIPSYEDTKLTDVEPAGGSNGARIAVDDSGNSWLVKPYRGDADRVATELLSNAVYRELGIRVPNAGIGTNTGPDGDQIAVSYPLIAGEIRQWDTPDAELGDGFVADALLANWDVIGLTQDNILWNNGQPIRLDQGGTLEFRAQGAPKDFGPIPAELWTMRSQNGQANGTMEITEAGMRDAARDASLRLPPQRIDQLVDEAPFADEGMRERVRQSLKDRVAWLERFADGKEGLPEPLEGDDAIDYLEDRDQLLLTDPEEDAALAAFMGGMGGAVERHLQSGAPKEAATEEVREIVSQLDGLLGIEDTQTDEDLIAFARLPRLENPDALMGRMVTEKSFLPLSLRAEPDAETTLRVQIPAGTNVVSPNALGTDANPEAILLPRNSKLEITKVSTVDGRTQIEGQILTLAPPPATKPIETMSRFQLLKALGLEDSDLTDAELRDRLRLKRGAA